MEILDEETRLAVIFRKNGINLDFERVVTVSYNEDKSFSVITPNNKFTRYDESNFNNLDGNPSFIYGNNEILNLELTDDLLLEYAIYIFEPFYIWKLEQDKGLEENEAISFIKSKCKSIVLKQVSLNNQYISEKITNKYDMDISILNDNEDVITEDNIGTLITKNSIPFLLFINAQGNMYKQKNNTFSKSDINVEELIENISKKIVGQERAIKTLISNIYFNQVLIDYLEGKEDIDNELDSRKQAILLDGSTGTGKTAILKEIASKLKLPLVIANANSFSETGYVGPTITDILEKLLDQANGDIELAQRGIIVLDEIDKIAEPSDDSKNMKLGVQKELLGFMSGSTYELKTTQSSIDFDTSRITFILSGAFTNIKERKILENKKNNLGFSDSNDNKKNTYIVDYQDYIDEGLMREFFGRIKVITTTKTYSRDDLKNILLTSEISPLLGFEKTCIMLGYPGIKCTDDLINEICDEAYLMSTGARGLQSLISGIQDTLLVDLMIGDYDKNLPIELDINNLKKYKERNKRSY